MRLLGTIIAMLSAILSSGTAKKGRGSPPDFAITTAGGADTFDAGSMNISYE
jgi:hypothetical protein